MTSRLFSPINSSCAGTASRETRAGGASAVCYRPWREDSRQTQGARHGVTGERKALDELARHCRVAVAYDDAQGVRRVASTEALLAVLRALGVEIESPAHAAQIDRELAGERHERLLAPVVVAWDGELEFAIDAPRHPAFTAILTREGGSPEEISPRRLERPRDANGATRFRLVEPLPVGYHRLEVALGNRAGSTLVISAPRRAFSPPENAGSWGLFLPLYSLRSERDWGAGDLTDLADLAGWAAERGASLVGTLPLYASFLEHPFEPSPYAPASRLFWNELYLDPTRLPEIERSKAAREILSSAAFSDQRERLRAAGEVDYAALYKLKRSVLELLAAEHFTRGTDARRRALAAFELHRPEVLDYAAFRAHLEGAGNDIEQRHEEDLPNPLEPSRRGALAASAPGRYHRYVQWAASEQLDQVAHGSDGSSAGLYLDLPLGVHWASYDLWRYRGLFAPGVAVGAPPDPFFIQGQNWGFPPLVPERLRASGYDYWARVLRTALAPAALVRLDHAMQLHRLFWIPEGFAAADGVYVHYPAAELYAVLSVESHRANVPIVAENLGTTSAEIDRSLVEHAIAPMYVAEFAGTGDPNRPLAPPRDDAFACLSTHDLPPFPGFLAGDDLALRRAQGILKEGEEPRERDERDRFRSELARSFSVQGLLGQDDLEDTTAITRAAAAYLAASPAATVMINLEELWGERRSQNLPGGEAERGNWRRKAALTLAELKTDGDLGAALKAIARERRKRREDLSKKSKAGDAPRASIDQPLGDHDLYLFNEGRHFRLGDRFGAHLTEREGERGTRFAVWAPNASAVSVVGDWNGWDRSAQPLEPRGSSGVWEGFVPGVGQGALYKYFITSRLGGYRGEKADPFAFYSEQPPRTASRVWDLAYDWDDKKWMRARREGQSLSSPISIYEVHLGSWRRRAGGDRSLSYGELAAAIGDHVERLGFTHVELLPIMEHPFFGSWGYQTTGYFAPTSRYGAPQDLMAFIDHLHQRGIGVILDWVPSHFATDAHGLGYFDGSHLYEHADPRLGFHPDWGSFIFNYGRHEVRSFLISSALFWLEHYHADGIRVDAVASMLYRDYSRREGEWLPNEHGGRENLEAISFLRQLNEEIYRSFPDVQTFAEESTAWPMVSRPTYVGGLGFGFKWDMGWMHDTLQYLEREPVHRKYHQGELTFRSVYAFSENFCLPLSHDEVVHGKGALLSKMPGDSWQKFANLRLLFAYQYAQPGKKLLFMGSELATWNEWDHESELHWSLEGEPWHRGIEQLISDLNRLYRRRPAMAELDCDPAGFEWLDASDTENSVLAFMRHDRSGERVLCVFNFTPVVRHNYRLGVPLAGTWNEILNTDSEVYGGGGQGNLGAVEAAPAPRHGRPHSLTLTLPPLGAVFLLAPRP